MNYILCEDLLPLSHNKQANLQYYKWTEKKRLQKQKAQQDHLFKKLLEIKEEEIQKQKAQSKVKITTKLSRRQNTSCSKQDQIYDKNIMWKQLVDDKIEKLRTEMKQYQLKQQQKHRQTISRIHQKKMFKEKEHKGPLKAWNERFQHYLRNKHGQFNNNQQSMFHPTINDKSKSITHNIVGKVQTRLIQYGERLKEKKAELEQAYSKQLHNKKIKQSTVSVDSCSSDTFFRLYKDGERLNRRKNEFESQYTFIPQINKKSNTIASKAIQKRKPLYPSKLNQQKKTIEHQNCNKKDIKTREKSFDDFLRRNEALINKIQLHKYKKNQQDKQKQNKISKECTFVPILNPHSLKIAANRFMQSNNSHQFSLRTSDKIPSKIYYNKDSKNAETSVFENKSSILKIGNPDRQFSQKTKINISDEEKNVLFSQIDFYLNDSHHQIIKQKSLRFDKEINTTKHQNILRNIEIESDIPIDRLSEPKAVINEEYEQDSIQKVRNIQWQNDLDFMEAQIQEMMKRVSN